MWSREQPGLPRQWEPRGVCRALPAPRCCCFRVRHRQEEPYKGQVKNQERFLLHPRASSIPGCSLECSQCPGNNISALAFSGASGRWEWPAPSQRVWHSLSPGSPDRPAVHWSGQEPPAGGWLGQGRAAQGAGPLPAEVRRDIPADRHLGESPGHGAAELQQQLQAPLRLRGPPGEPGHGRAPRQGLLPLPHPGAHPAGTAGQPGEGRREQRQPSPAVFQSLSLPLCC